MNDMGLVWDRKRHSFVWGWKHGFGRGWLPYWLSHPFVQVVNWGACRIWEHDWFFDIDQLDGELPFVGDGRSDEDVEAYWERNRAEVCGACGAKRMRPGRWSFREG